MSEEEKKAIEVLKEMIGKSKDLREEDFYSLIGIHQIQAISTVLNLIEKQQKEIEKKDKIIDLMSLAILNYDDQLVINKYKDIEQVKETFKDILENETYNKQYFERRAEDVKN